MGRPAGSGMVRWREAMASALYGPDGFFVRPGPGPAAHFRTSAHTSPLFAAAVLRLLERVDEALGRPEPLDLVDVGAGRGELLSAVTAAAPAELAARLRPRAVELAPDPGSDVPWSPALPSQATGLLLATEWLDNAPVDVAEVDDAGIPRYVLVDPATGAEVLGPPVAGTDAEWLARWWPLSTPGTRAEIGRPRDEAWASAVAALARGVALTVDYGHMLADRPPLGTLTGFRDGREVPPVPDGSCDLTAHVALDAVAAAGTFALHTYTHHPAAGRVYVCRAKDAEAVLARQAEAVRALGLTGRRPPRAQAERDPAGYLRALAAASSAAELSDPAGLGGHYWLLQPVGISDPSGLPAASAAGWPDPAAGTLPQPPVRKRGLPR